MSEQGTLNDYLNVVLQDLRRIHSALISWKKRKADSESDADSYLATSLLLSTFHHMRRFAFAFQAANLDYRELHEAIEADLKLKQSPSFAMGHGPLLLIYKDGQIRISSTPEDDMPGDERLTDSDFYMSRVESPVSTLFERKENLN